MAKAASTKKVVRKRRERKNIEKGAAHIRKTLNADYFSIADDRTRVINDIIEHVSGKVALFGWHDWMVRGVKSVYLGSANLTREFVDADVLVAGKSVSHTSKVIDIAYFAKKASYLSFITLLIFKIVVAIFALFGVASVYFALIGEFVIYIALSLFWTFRFKRL